MTILVIKLLVAILQRGAGYTSLRHAKLLAAADMIILEEQEENDPNAKLFLCDCGSQNFKCLDSRPTPFYRRRRYQCRDCRFKFTTREMRVV